jgi:exosortase/archaeosortase family protein
VAGPLLYLYFLVPFGEFLTPVLQDITTWFIDGGLGLLGVPAYIDGYVIEIPQGTFFVAEACAGLRFLIASLAFGSLYALTMYRSPIRRVVFIVVSIVVPVIANGFRAIGIVYLGYVLDSARAAAADHVIYGWLFFSFVILLLIVLGLPFRQDDMTTRPAPAGRQRAPIRQPGWRVAATAAAGLVGVACVSPALSAGLSIASRTPPVTAGGIVPGPGCTASAPPVSDAGSPAVRSQRMTCGEMAMDVRWEALSPRSTAAAVMQARWELSRPVRTEGLSEAWLQAGDGKPTDWLIMRSSDLDSMLAVAVWIDGKPVRPGLRMRLRMALDSLLGASHAPLVMTVAPAVDWQALTDTERGIVGTRLAEVLGSGSALDQSAGASTSLR